MAAEGHHGVGIDPSLDQVTYATAPEIVHDPARESDLLARRSPSLTEIANLLPLPMEDEGRVESTLRDSSLDHLGQLPNYWNPVRVDAMREERALPYLLNGAFLTATTQPASAPGFCWDFRVRLTTFGRTSTRN
jgi:hypothetical protein